MTASEIRSLEEVFEYDTALVFGIGGGGDVVGTVPTARLLELHGVDCIIGGIAWERVPHDPKPGPRSFDEIDYIDEVSPTVGLVSPETVTSDDYSVEFTETKVAEHYSKTSESESGSEPEPDLDGFDVALIDITEGVDAVTEGIDEFCDSLGVDLVVGTDSGGDALAVGDEEGLKSPIADSFSMLALTESEVDSVLGVFGYGSDGELSLDELDAGVERAAERDGLLGSWGLSRRVVREMDSLLDDVNTEASRLPVEAAEGDLGRRQIRGGSREVEMTPASTVTFYFSPSSVAETSGGVSAVRSTDGFEDAVESLTREGFTTEIEIENEKARHL
ncbi:MAG: DUF1152 domain-containing protein [Halobacteria archaeon]|nr:DUF1152 domain-containing protein [Halobacteria archaeon]